MSRAKAVFIPPAKLVVVARSSYPIQCRTAHRLPGIALLRVKLRERYFPHIVRVQPGFALLFKHGGDQLVQVL